MRLFNRKDKPEAPEEEPEEENLPERPVIHAEIGGDKDD